MNQNAQWSSLPKEGDGHFYWLDLIRFLAAFAVMASHFRGAFLEEYSLLPASQQNIFSFVFYTATRLGFESVLIFFVLSGMLVGGKSIDRIQNRTFKSRDYVIDRSVRILLPLIASLLLFLPIAHIMGISPSIWVWLGSLFSLQGIFTPPLFDTLWSLSYEVWFYIIMLGLALVVSKYSRTKSLIGLGILFIGMLVFMKLKVEFLFIWIIGALTFVCYRNSRFRKNLFCCSLLLSLILLAGLQLTSESHSGTTTSSEWARTIISIAFGLVFAIFLQQIIHLKPKSKVAFKCNDIGTKLAAFSYTLYLTHIPVMELLRYLGAPKSPTLNLTSICLYAVWMIVAIAVAYIMYLLFEKNTPQVKKWIHQIVNRLSNKKKSATIIEVV